LALEMGPDTLPIRLFIVFAARDIHR